MQDLFSVPEYAIQTFEQLTGLSVVVHDMQDALWPYLTPERFHHHTPWCTAVKIRGFNERCHEFEVTRLERPISALPEGRIHRCHAGFVEWVMPLFEDGALACILFAGQRTAVADIPGLVVDERATWVDGIPASRLPAVDAEQAERYRESLCQLVARLSLWRSSVKAIVHQPSGAGGLAEANRIVRIRRFISGRHTAAITIADLATELRLSPGRTAHLVRELFGQTFHALLTEARLRTAASLLRHTPLAIVDVAYTSGFSDPSHFYRVFKQRMHVTPHWYRSYSGSETAGEC